MDIIPVFYYSAVLMPNGFKKHKCGFQIFFWFAFFLSILNPLPSYEI